ncbi:unnamed protein product [Polarella glacialis]|uniref:Uncharacterized protein n=1 Tax=Polarella glacialis TaxID=89957 RepID=A0A813JZQ7_POLGL|nr:unnamed protein product [Polarella glacialis]CAE8689986.1 unnamed protein product [Polarella glacialis]
MSHVVVASLRSHMPRPDVEQWTSCPDVMPDGRPIKHINLGLRKGHFQEAYACILRTPASLVLDGVCFVRDEHSQSSKAVRLISCACYVQATIDLTTIASKLAHECTQTPLHDSKSHAR